MLVEFNKRLYLKLKHDAQYHWWLIIPAILIFFVSIGALIFSSFYDWEIAVFFGKFFHQPFGNFLAHWASYTGNKMLFLALVPAVMIIVETYFLKAKTYKPDSFIAKHYWILFVLYAGFFAIFFGVNTAELLHQRFFDYGWGPGINAPFIETYETGLIFRSIICGINFIYYCGVIYFIHYKLARKKLLIKYDYWVSSLKILLFASLIYFMVGITKLIMGRPFYFSNIYRVNPDGGKSIIEEMQDAGFVWKKDVYQQLPYMEWWQPFQPYPRWHELISFNFDSRLYNTDFPSGHMASAAIFLTLFFYGIEQPKKSKTYKLTIIFCYGMLLEFLSIYFGMIIHRFHWMSDMAFTMIFNIIFIWFAHVKIKFWSQCGIFHKYLPLLSKNDKIIVANYKKTTAF